MPITKYISFSHFEDLVENGLYISCASEFDDWWEATLAYCDADGIPRADDNFEMLKTHLDWIYVSCWTKRKTESYPMWRLYGGWSEKAPSKTSAVAITLASQDLANCFNQHHADKYAKACSIAYKRPESETVKHQSTSGPHFKKGANHPDFQLTMTMMFLTQKHFSYDFEDEFRLICCPDEIPAQSRDLNLKLPNEQKSIRLPIHKERITCTVTASPNMTDVDFDTLHKLSSKTAWKVTVKRSELEIPFSWKKRCGS